MIRIFIGTEAKTRIPELVLQHSIRRRTKAEVSFVSMGDVDPWLAPKDVHQATGFSLRRWMIPAECQFQGHAIYLDADQIVLGDIQELWNYKDANDDVAMWCCFRRDKCSQMLTGNPFAEVPQTSVMLLNCGLCDPGVWSRKKIFDRIRAAGKPHSGKAVVKAYQWVMHGMDLYEKRHELPDHWNEFNKCPHGTRLLHYTFETQQPWYQPWHELADVWEVELKQAILDGAIPRSDFEAALLMGEKRSADHRAYAGMNASWAKLLPLFDVEQEQAGL